jgi:hypothetical protein
LVHLEASSSWYRAEGKAEDHRTASQIFEKILQDNPPALAETAESNVSSTT